MIVQLSSGDLSARLEPSDARDSLDAVITGINLLAEELELTMEERVAERTMVLEQARIALERMALYDALTGLAEPHAARRPDPAGECPSRTGRPAAVRPGARPRRIQDRQRRAGHSAGDRILIEVARRLTSVVRETDTVARLGGDEFAILMPDTTEDDALRVAERALKELHSPFAVGDRPVWAGASIGLCFGLRGQSADYLLRDADTAMYVAKAKGRGNIQVFRPEMHQTASERLRIASELGEAIDQGRTRPALPTDRRAGLRPNRRRRGAGAVAASRAGAAVAGRLHPGRRGQRAHHRTGSLGCAVRRSASSGPGRAEFPAAPFQLHVNLAPVEVRWPGMAEFIRDALGSHGVQPHRLALEISETGLMTGDVAGLDALMTLKNLGVGVEIDDFGTGYSSISYLRRLPIDTVKVDQSLDPGYRHGQPAGTFVSAILRLIESVGLRTSSRESKPPPSEINFAAWDACTARASSSASRFRRELMTNLLAEQNSPRPRH